MNYSGSADLQYHLNIKTGDVGKYVILPGDPKRVPLIAKYLDKAKLVADKREFVTYTGNLDGVKVSVTSTGIGGPSAAIAVEELIKAGANTFLRVGTCGGIQERVKSGDIVIATGAVRAEGTSLEYAPIEFPAVATLDVINAFVQGAKKVGVAFHTGVVQCKDSFYGQHSPNEMPVSSMLNARWSAWKKLGVLASEMESAAIFSVCAARGARCGSCFLTIANQEREAAGLSNPVVHDTDLAIRCTIEALRELIKEDKKIRGILVE